MQTKIEFIVDLRQQTCVTQSEFEYCISFFLTFSHSWRLFLAQCNLICRFAQRDLSNVISVIFFLHTNKKKSSYFSRVSECVHKESDVVSWAWIYNSFNKIESNRSTIIIVSFINCFIKSRNRFTFLKEIDCVHNKNQ